VARAWLENPDLETLSLWNPSFLLAQLEWIRKRRGILIAQAGTRMPGTTRCALESEPIRWREVFPGLKLISCWADGNAAEPAGRLQQLFPGILIQAKGILATEAPITLPWRGRAGVPLLEDIYFEFEDENGTLHELHEIHEGRTYGLILSTPGGLYRYRMGDRVRVNGRIANTPTLTFEGRGPQTSDLVGEKLTSVWALQCIREVLAADGEYHCILPIRSPTDGYLCVLNGTRMQQARACEQTELEMKLDQALSRAHHYGLARRLGQLAPVRIRSHPQAEELITQLQLRSGMRLGDIKGTQFTPRIADATLQSELGLIPGAES
jgi:hypothetical protein